jgi:hypothetical protein
MKLTVEHLLNAIKQLSSAELREFTWKFTEWQEQNGAAEESVLLAEIKENSRLPIAEQQRRYERLRCKCEDKALIECEFAEYQSLLQQLEARNSSTSKHSTL